MTTKNFLTLAGAALLLVLAVTLPALAGDGPPAGKGNKKGDVGKSIEGFLYGDLYVIERDGNGQPVLYEDPSPCYDEDVGIACAQPLMASCEYIPLMCLYEGDWTEDLDLVACLEANGVEDPLGEIDPENLWEPELCDLHPCFLDTVQEVHFGRMSVARTMPDVVDKAYLEALSTINSALGVGQDLAGRIVLDLPLLDEDGQLTTEYVDADLDGFCDEDENGLIVVDSYEKTIDSPLENLALYRELMRNSCLGGIEDTYVGEGGAEIEEWTYLEPQAIELLIRHPVLKHLVCSYEDIELAIPLPEGDWWMEPEIPADTVAFEDHDLAATFVGAAADKTGHVTLDMAVNANTYLEINTFADEPVPGEAPDLTYHNFIETGDLGEGWYQYNAATVHPSGTTAQVLTADSVCEPGCFCVGEVDPFLSGSELIDFDNSAVPVCRGGELLMESSDPHYCRQDSLSGGIMAPFSLGESSIEAGCGGANWFTQAAEDARQTIWFLHNWSVPEIGECMEPPY